ncbi:DUF6207 family protein [Streptomyces sp. QHH-9511]|uniref:DUF6207 family protein n=1 Tax=Streptomyces sp. QHH-9511 TaxID=2684468 RepID=UPI003FCDB478
MAQGLPALAAEQEAQGQDAGPRAGARRGLIPGIGSDLSAVPAAPAGFGEIRCGRWAAATSDLTTRVPGQLSVRLRCLDVRQAAGSRVRTRTRFADGRAGWKAGAVTWTLPEPMRAAPVSDPVLLPAWAGPDAPGRGRGAAHHGGRGPAPGRGSGAVVAVGAARVGPAHNRA